MQMIVANNLRFWVYAWVQFMLLIMIVFNSLVVYANSHVGRHKHSHHSFQPQHSLITKVQRDCELEALSIGSRLSDRWNNFDEDTEWDTRIHHDYLVKYLGFAGWIQMGLWKNTQLTALRQSAPAIHKSGGWAGSKNISESAYWALENKWLYMMGDSTQRQIWATFVSPFQNNDFERNAKEWTREKCDRQFPKRKQHPQDHYFPEEGWGGRCGNNEVTCHLSGFGPEGKITFDWKHFPYEDYDEWLFGEQGLWQWNASASNFPHVLVIHVGLHTCIHANNAHPTNESMILQHERDIATMMVAVHKAVHRTPSDHHRTEVIIQLPGRAGNSDAKLDRCSREFNRLLAHEAHKMGFSVFEREEIERRALFKSEFYTEKRTLKPLLHLENPGPNIVGTSLLGLITCLARNGTDHNIQFRPIDVP